MTNEHGKASNGKEQDKLFDDKMSVHGFVCCRIKTSM